MTIRIKKIKENGMRRDTNSVQKNKENDDNNRNNENKRSNEGRYGRQ